MDARSQLDMNALPRLPGLELLVLHGSRGRGDAHAGSDWDFAFLGTGIDREELLRRLTDWTGTDAVDLVDLQRASALFAFHVARDGRALFEAGPGRFEAFQIQATLRWLDMEPVVRQAHREVLARLGP